METVLKDLSFYRISQFQSIQGARGWKEVEIKEVNEPLVLLNNLDPDKIVVYPEYFRKGLKGASENQYLRKGVAERLVRAASLLQKIAGSKHKLKVYDAWRPLEVQQALFDTEFDRIKKVNPNWSDEQISEETQRFVSLPSSDPTKPSPHATGGAVDLVIVKGEEEVPLSPVEPDDTSDEYGMMARTDYYETTTNPDEFKFRDWRRLLCFCMSQAGFTNYPEEWWHFDYGNQFWGKIIGQKAIYGLVQ